MKFGTDTGEYENDSRNILKFVIGCHFHFKAFDDYVTLHNLRMLLRYIVTLYHNIIHALKLYTRDVVIVSL